MQVSTRQQNQTYGIIALWFCLLCPRIMKLTSATFLPITNYFEDLYSEAYFMFVRIRVSWVFFNKGIIGQLALNVIDYY